MAKKVATKARGGKTSTKKNKQDHLDPRQILFLQNYYDPKSPTFANGVQSAMKAGFSEEYSIILMSRMPTWVQSGKVKFDVMLDKAEQNLFDMIDMDPIVPAMGPFGPLMQSIPIGKKIKGKKQKTKKVPIMTTSMKILELKNKTSQFVAERLDKKRWSARGEITGAEGQPIILQIAPEIAAKNALPAT